MKKIKALSDEKVRILAIYLIGLAIWQLSYYILAERLGAVKAYIFPSPLGILNAFGALAERGILFGAVINSFQKMLIGFSASVVLGVLMGLLMTRHPFFSKALKPLLLGIQTLPSICFVPFALLWFGLNDFATIFVVIIGSVFSITLSTESAIKSVNPLFIQAAKTMGATERDIYLKVILPAGVLPIVSGLKHGWSFAWRALITGEMVSGTIGGLGYVLLMGRELLEINQIMVVVIVLIITSVIIERLVFGKAEDVARARMGQS